MKTILYLYHVSDIGGGSFCLLNILKAADRKKITPVVLLKNEGPLAERIRQLGIEVFSMPSMCTVPYNHSLCRIKNLRVYVKALRSRKNLAVFLRQHSVDVVYLNNMMLYPYLKTARRCGKKTVIHVREHWPLNEHTVQLGWARKAVNRYADRVVAINRYSMSMFPGAEAKASIVYDWIDFSDRGEPRPFDKIFNEDCSKLKVYLYTGGNQKIKGALEIVTVFSKYIRGEGERLLMLGVHPVHYKGLKGKIVTLLSHFGILTYNEKLCRATGRDSRITCIPSTYAIEDIFRQAYCLLSYFTMQHANLSLAESIALKLPAVAAETPESLEYTCNGKYAKLFKFQDMADFITKIDELRNDYADLKVRLEQGSKAISRMFDREANAAALSDIYETL